MLKRTVATLAASGLMAGTLALAPMGHAAPSDTPARETEAVTITGDKIPEWSRLAATGVAQPWPSGTEYGDGTRDAHNGTLIVPPDARTGAKVDEIAAYKWSDGLHRYVEVPVQVDERFPYFLANARSDFGFYSGTDEELTYAWDTENWKKTAGDCFAQYPPGEGATPDPVPGLDDDDEITFMASDAGSQAPSDAAPPPGATSDGYDIALLDQFAPDQQKHVYLFLTATGPSFDADNGYVNYQRHANADEWVDRNNWADDDTEKLGSSNTGYGPNLEGSVCNADGTVRASTDRFPRDGVTVTTAKYKWTATGRWMIRGMQVAKPNKAGSYGPDLIDRWKGRAFQQSPDSTVSLVGFEDEQVNWEANATLLGELAGPVRAIREVWGADSGTNVTKIETFYRDKITYRYHVRVHPIPADGLYTSWDYNHDQVQTYYNEALTDGVPIDGKSDEAVGNIDDIFGEPAFFDAPDPTFTRPLAFLNWEQVAGKGNSGSLVYIFELKNLQSLENPLVTPYYRDDACLDDGTGDDPSPRMWPGESYAWMSERNIDYVDRPCFTDEGASGPYRQGAFGTHGIHYFVTNDTDNAFGPKPVTEIDGQQTEWAVPQTKPERVGDTYANTVKVPLIATPYFLPGGSSQPDPEPSPTASPTPTATPTPTPSPDGSPSDETETSFRVSARSRKGHEATFGGVVHKDEGCAVPVEVDLLRKVAGTDAWEVVASATPDDSGAWGLTVTVDKNANYAAETDSGGVCSDNRTHEVQMSASAVVKILSYKHKRNVLKGEVSPEYPGTTVKLFQKKGGTWRKLGTDKLNRNSRFKFHEGLRNGRVYKVAWKKQSVENERGSKRFRI